MIHYIQKEKSAMKTTVTSGRLIDFGAFGTVDLEDFQQESKRQPISSQIEKSARSLTMAIPTSVAVSSAPPPQLLV